MKQDLEVVRFTHAFELETFNIREPPKDVPEETAKQIAELYKNDIVSRNSRPKTLYNQTNLPDHLLAGTSPGRTLYTETQN